MAGTHLPDDPCLQGDEAELFRLYFRKLVRLVRYDTGVPTAVAEDCASFAFLQLCRTQPVRGERIAGWLRVTARREAYAWRRKPGRCMSLDAGANRHGSIDNGEPGATAEVVRAPVDVELALEAREALRTLASLKRRQRDTLALKVAGYSYREIQAIRAVTYTNVNRHVCEGRAAARSLRDAA